MIKPGGRDLCRRRHAETGAECCLPDTHYPRPHCDVSGTSWHDGLCPDCHGGGDVFGAVCPTCNGHGFELIKIDED